MIVRFLRFVSLVQRLAGSGAAKSMELAELVVVQRSCDNPSHSLGPANQLVKTHPGGVLLKGEVLGSSYAKRTNNLPVDVEVFPPTVRG
ncbi:hypothetical protein F2Q69_00046225 [Brassica cretica]|uniref:Secreted protein n=1 Tax=Brassica cretica TaxID=69181 RepID=A0A8S9PN44_BRACR|nr:hypothetical protein F2Q69_00046225 [Brassica cretica]